MNQTALNATVGGLGALRDPDATGAAIVALRELCAADLAALLGEMIEGDHALTDDVMRAGVRLAMRSALGDHADDLQDATRYLEGVAGDGFSPGDLQGIAEAMEDACDGFEKVGVDTVLAWSARLQEVADTIAEHGSRLTDSLTCPAIEAAGR